MSGVEVEDKAEDIVNINVNDEGEEEDESSSNSFANNRAQLQQQELEGKSFTARLWYRIKNSIILQSEDENARHSNRDLDPLPPSRRTWAGWQLACYWGSDMLQASALRTVVSITDLGISTKNALGAMIIGYFIIGVILTFNGRFGVKYHVPFAVQARASFGYYLSTLMVILRLIVGGIWYATNVYTGAECVGSIIYAMAPSFHNVKNHLPDGANIDTQTMICYFIYFCISLPFHYIRQEKMQWIFTLKTIIVPAALFAILGWGLAAADDPSSTWATGNTVHGSEFSWNYLSGIASGVSSYATLAVNVNDFTRYTDDRKAPYIQMFVLPVFIVFTSCVGLVMAAASEELWGEQLWDPLEVCNKWTSSGGRAAAFFVSLIFLFGQIAVNLSANCASAANDIVFLFPKIFNIRRGQFLIAFVFAWGATPWNILEGATSFLNFMDGYAIFLGPMAAVLVSDMYLVHRNKYDITEFYKADGIYRYNKYGINWRALVAFLIGCIPQIPMFAHAVNASIPITDASSKFYDLGYFYNFPATFFTYGILCKIFPAKETYLEHAVGPDDIDFRAAMSHEHPLEVNETSEKYVNTA